MTRGSRPRNKFNVDEETTIRHSTSKSSELFQMFFLVDDESQNVEVVETPEIDFKEVVQRLMNGESCFIKLKHLQRSNLSRKLINDTDDSLFYRI